MRCTIVVPCHILKFIPLKTSHRDVFKILLIEKGLQGGSGLVRFPLEKLSLFSPLFSAAQSMRRGVSPPAGGDQGRCPWTLPGLLALDLASIFEKLLDQKTSLPSCLFESRNEIAQFFRFYFPTLSITAENFCMITSQS